MKQLLQQFTLRASLLVILLLGGVINSWGQKSYQLITSTSELEAGANYLIATLADGGTGNVEALAEAQSNNRKSTTLTATNNIITTTVASTTSQVSVAYAITLVASGSNWNLKDVVADKFLNGGSKKSSGNNNYLKTETSVNTQTGTGNNNGVWTISIASDGKATITNQNNFKIQKNSTNQLIASYSSNYVAVGLYKEINTSTSVATTTTINATGITNTDVYTSTAAGSLSATVSAEGNTISGATVTWSSSNTDVATIDADGVVTLVTAGTTIITASYAGDEGQYLPSSTIYELTVTDSTPFEGGDVTFIGGTDLGSTSANNSPDQVTKSGVTIYSTDAAFATAQYRLYSGSQTTISTTSGKITKIVFTKNGSYDLSNLSTETGTYTSNTGTWAGNASSIIFDASAQVRLDKIVVTITPDGVVVLPTPTVTVSGNLTLDLDGETNVSAGMLSATVTYDDEAVAGATVTWSSSNPSVATINENTGNVTLLSIGEVTFTATFAGNSEYQSATGTKTVTVVDSNAPGSTENNPYTVAQARAAIDAGTGVTGVYATGIVSAIVDEYNTQYKNITFDISVDGSTSADQLRAYRCKKSTATNAPDVEDIQVGDVVVIYGDLTNYQGTYEFTTGNVLVSLEREKEDPNIVVSDATVPYGSTFTIDESVIEGGEITVTSGNTSIATISGLTITPVAVGSVVITVATAENDLYNAGEETFTLTVTAPEGQTTAPSASTGSVLFNETFDRIEGTGGRDDTFTGSVGTNATANFLDEEWNDISNYGAYHCIKLGTGSAFKSVTTSNIALSGNGILSFSAAGWGSGTNTVSVSASGATLSGDIEVTLENGVWNNYTVNISNGNGEVNLTFSMKRGFLDEVKVAAPAGEAPTESYTIPSSGLGTYCSQYPIDLDALPSGVKAYAVESKTSEKVTLTELSGTIKGGTGFILEGVGGTVVTFTFADSNTEPENLLVGTLAPTYVAANTVYGLSGGKFHPNNAGTMPAHRAYLPNEEAGVKALVIEFKNIVTGITHTRTITDEATIYDLTGRRASKTSKGIYIVNGKKVAVK